MSLALLLVSSCTSGSLNSALGTPKNPTPVYSDPDPESHLASALGSAARKTSARSKPGAEATAYADFKAKLKARSRIVDGQIVFLLADYGVLLEAIDFQSRPIITRPVPKTYDMRRYLAAGFNLSNAYCTRFLNKTDEAYRRRGYARSVGNDVGTAITTILGLANAGEAAVSALAAATGLTDSALRNYDASFLITPDLASVKSLLRAKQANFRAQYLGPEGSVPADFDTAQSVIRDYADLCSFQGMKELLTTSAGQQQEDLKTDTKKLVEGKRPADGTVKSDARAPQGAAVDAPALAEPPLATNAPKL